MALFGEDNPSYKHGMTGAPEYRVWSKMLNRCRDINTDNYKWYGGRGIVVCEEWLDFTVFSRDMGRRPSEKHSLDRIDNDGAYSKRNCRWSTMKEQSRNRRGNIRIMFNGESLCLAEIIELTGVKGPTLRYRIRAGWPIEKAIKRKDFRKES